MKLFQLKKESIYLMPVMNSVGLKVGPIPVALGDVFLVVHYGALQGINESDLFHLYSHPVFLGHSLSI